MAMFRVKPGADVGGQCVGGGVRANCKEEDEEVRPAEAGREYQVNTLKLIFTFR